jgi:hypothetical protein
MQPRYPRQLDQSARYVQQLQTQHDVDIKRLWGLMESVGNPYSGPSDISLPTTSTSTTSTTTASPPCCASYSCADVFIPDILDVDGVTTIPGGWFRLTGVSGCVQTVTEPDGAIVTFLESSVPGLGNRYVITYQPAIPFYGYTLTFVLDETFTCPGPETSVECRLSLYGVPSGYLDGDASITLVSCSDPTSTTTTTSTTTAEPTTTTTTTTTTTSTTTPGDLLTTTTTSTTTGDGGGTTTTTTTSTTTGSGDCWGSCGFEWYLAPGQTAPYWNNNSGPGCSENPGPGGCACSEPPRDGYYLGEIYNTNCTSA